MSVGGESVKNVKVGEGRSLSVVGEGDEKRGDGFNGYKIEGGKMAP